MGSNIKNRVDKLSKTEILDILRILLTSNLLSINNEGRLIAKIGPEYIDVEEYRNDILANVPSTYFENFFAKYSRNNGKENIANKMTALYSMDHPIYKDLMPYVKYQNLQKQIRGFKGFIDGIVIRDLKTEIYAINTFYNYRTPKNSGNDVLTKILNKNEYSIFEKDYHKNMHDYIFQLIEEGILSEEALLQSEFFYGIDSEEIIEYILKGNISREQIAYYARFKSINNKQLKQLIENDFFKDGDTELFKKLFENSFINIDNVEMLINESIVSKEEIVEIFGGYDELGNYYLQAVRNKKKKSAEEYYNLLDDLTLCELYARGRIELKDIERRQLSKEDLTQLPNDILQKIIQKGLPEGISFSRDELLEIGITVTISANELEEMYLNDELTEERFIEYYNKGAIDNNGLEAFYGDKHEEIISMVKQGILDERALLIINAKEAEDLMYQGVLTTEDVFKFYLNNKTITIDELKRIFDEYGELKEERINLVDMLPEGCDLERIKELREAKLLSHQDLFDLEEKGVITKDERQEIETMDLARKFAERFNDENKKLENLREEYLDIVGHEQNNTSSKRKSTKMSAVKRIDFLMELGATKYQDIESINPDGKPAPFAGYTLFGFPDYGIVLLENLEKAENATYLMTMQEFDTYITEETKDSVVFTKSKQTLRKDFEKKGRKAIDFADHRANWGNKIISIMQNMSDKAKAEISDEQKSKLSKMMRQEYFDAQFRILLKERDEAKEEAEELERRVEEAENLKKEITNNRQRRQERTKTKK